MAERNHLFLVDGSGYIFRAYYALPPLYRKSDGLPTGAVNGFCNMLYKLIEDTDKKISPTHLAVIFDSARKTFRNEIYKEYKANRGDPPEDLIPQFKIIKDAVRAFGIPSIELSGYEADDIIATYASLAENKKWNVSIVSSDKDLMQIVSNQVKLIDVISMVRDSLAGRASQRGMTITLSDQRTDQKRVPVMLGSFDEMTEVFVNIVENAIKYGYENNIYDIPEGWVTHKCHTSFNKRTKFSSTVCDSYADLFDSIFDKKWSGSFEYWYSVYKLSLIHISEPTRLLSIAYSRMLV